MSLETEHRRHHTEPTQHPDEPQPIKWTGRRAEPWTTYRTTFDLYGIHAKGHGTHRKPWRRRAAPWTLETAETDNDARYPEWSAAA